MTRVRDWVVLALIPIVIVAAMAAPAWVIARVNDVQLAITCKTIQANADQLHALNRISSQLGLPKHYPIPEVPVECDGR